MTWLIRLIWKDPHVIGSTNCWSTRQMLLLCHRSNAWPSSFSTLRISCNAWRQPQLVTPTDTMVIPSDCQQASTSLSHSYGFSLTTCRNNICTSIALIMHLYALVELWYFEPWPEQAAQRSKSRRCPRQCRKNCPSSQIGSQSILSDIQRVLRCCSGIASFWKLNLNSCWKNTYLRCPWFGVSTNLIQSPVYSMSLAAQRIQAGRKLLLQELLLLIFAGFRDIPKCDKLHSPVCLCFHKWTTILSGAFHIFTRCACSDRDISSLNLVWYWKILKEFLCLHTRGWPSLRGSHRWNPEFIQPRNPNDGYSPTSTAKG